MTSAVFHDFPGLENGLPKFQDFPGPVVTLYRSFGVVSYPDEVPATGISAQLVTLVNDDAVWCQADTSVFAQRTERQFTLFLCLGMIFQHINSWSPVRHIINYYYYQYKNKDYSDTITQKRCRSTLQSSKCDADAPEYSARTFALLMSMQMS